MCLGRYRHNALSIERPGKWRVVKYEYVAIWCIEWQRVSRAWTPKGSRIATVQKAMRLICDFLATVLHAQCATCATADLSAVGYVWWGKQVARRAQVRQEIEGGRR